MRKILNNSLILIVCMLILGCDTDVVWFRDDITDNVQFENICEDSLIINSIYFSIDTILILDTDKDHGYEWVAHAEMKMNIYLTLCNLSEQDKRLFTSFWGEEDVWTPFYCFYKHNAIIDSLPLFADIDFDEPKLIRKNECYELLLHCINCSFEGLFEDKDDYAEDMAKLIETMYFKYNTKGTIADSDEISLLDTYFVFTAHNNTKILISNEKLVSVIWKRVMGWKDVPAYNYVLR